MAGELGSLGDYSHAVLVFLGKILWRVLGLSHPYPLTPAQPGRFVVPKYPASLPIQIQNQRTH